MSLRKWRNSFAGACCNCPMCSLWYLSCSDMMSNNNNNNNNNTNNHMFNLSSDCVGLVVANEKAKRQNLPNY